MGKYANVQASIYWLARCAYLIHFFAAFLLVGCAYYDFNSLQPPARFDHPFAGEVTIVEVEPQEIWDYCSKGVACMVEVTPTECLIVFNKAYANWRSLIMQHETAHCNGWSAAHEQ